MIPLKVVRLRKHKLTLGILVVSVCILAATRANAQGDDIFSAAKSGDLAKVKALLQENPALVNSTDHEGFSPLRIAIGNKNIDVVEFLLDSKAVVNAKDKEGRTPLEEMAALPSLAFSFHGDSATARTVSPTEDGSLKIADLLIAHGANVNLEADRAANAPLLLACSVKNWAFAEFLIKKGAAVNIVQPDVSSAAMDFGGPQDYDKGWTPLHYAAAYDSVTLASMLITRKAQVNAKSSLGETPLHLAARMGHKKMVEWLRQHGGHE